MCECMKRKPEQLQWPFEEQGTQRLSRSTGCHLRLSTSNSKTGGPRQTEEGIRLSSQGKTKPLWPSVEK